MWYGTQMVLNIACVYHIVSFTFLLIFQAAQLYFHYQFQTSIILSRAATFYFYLCFPAYSLFRLFSIFGFIFALLSLCFLFQSFFYFLFLCFVVRLPKNLFLIKDLTCSYFVSLIELFFIHFQNLHLYTITILIFVLLNLYITLLNLSHYLSKFVILIFLFPIKLKNFEY